MDITFSFHNDVRSLSIKCDILNKYQYSPIYGYLQYSNTNNILLNDINYDDFKIVLDVLNGNIKQWDTPINIYDYMNKNGLVDDIIIHLRSDYTNKINKRLKQIDDFINGDKIILTSDDKEQYKYFETQFKNNKKIIKCQITLRYGDIFMIHILDGFAICGVSRDGIKYINHMMLPVVDVIDSRIQLIKNYKDTLSTTHCENEDVNDYFRGLHDVLCGVYYHEDKDISLWRYENIECYNQKLFNNIYNILENTIDLSNSYYESYYMDYIETHFVFINVDNL